MSKTSLGPVKVCVLAVPSVDRKSVVEGLMVSVDRLLVSLPSLLTVTPRFSAIAEPSTPLSATGVTVAANGLTVTASVLVVMVLRLHSLSISLDAIVKVKLVSLAGVIVNVDRFQL